MVVEACEVRGTLYVDANSTYGVHSAETVILLASGPGHVGNKRTQTQETQVRQRGELQPASDLCWLVTILACVLVRTYSVQRDL